MTGEHEHVFYPFVSGTICGTYYVFVQCRCGRIERSLKYKVEAGVDR